MAQPFDITGYTYRAEQWCPRCILKPFWAGLADPETLLNTEARYRGIDRENEHSFDSGDFPKVIFRDQCEDGERCGSCGAVLEDITV